jgi:hypothetical protein
MVKKKPKRDERTVARAIEEDDPMAKDLTKYVTTKQAAGISGVAQDHVNRLLIAKKLKGTKIRVLMARLRAVY